MRACYGNTLREKGFPGEKVYRREEKTREMGTREEREMRLSKRERD